MEWQPIDTAPKDGRRILVVMRYDNGRTEVELVRWIVRRECWASGDGGWGDDRFDPEIAVAWCEVPPLPVSTAQ